MLVLYIRNLNSESLALQILEEQESEHWPGLAQETAKICKELDIENVLTTNLSIKNYRKIVLQACHKANEKIIRKKADGKTKCNKIIGEEYGKKDYVKGKSIHQARSIFRTKFGMHAFAGNYSHDRRFARTDWLCHCQKARENEEHLISGECETYGEIREIFKYLDELETLTKFLDTILKKRDQLDEEEKH